jgi:hypothetical protein
MIALVVVILIIVVVCLMFTVLNYFNIMALATDIEEIASKTPYKKRETKTQKTVALMPQHIAASIKEQTTLPLIMTGQMPETGETYTRGGGSIGEN